MADIPASRRQAALYRENAFRFGGPPQSSTNPLAGAVQTAALRPALPSPPPAPLITGNPLLAAVQPSPGGTNALAMAGRHTLTLPPRAAPTNAATLLGATALSRPASQPSHLAGAMNLLRLHRELGRFFSILMDMPSLSPDRVAGALQHAGDTGMLPPEITTSLERTLPASTGSPVRDDAEMQMWVKSRAITNYDQLRQITASMGGDAGTVHTKVAAETSAAIPSAQRPTALKNSRNIAGALGGLLAQPGKLDAGKVRQMAQAAGAAGQVPSDQVGHFLDNMPTHPDALRHYVVQQYVHAAAKADHLASMGARA